MRVFCCGSILRSTDRSAANRAVLWTVFGGLLYLASGCAGTSPGIPGAGVTATGLRITPLRVTDDRAASLRLGLMPVPRALETTPRRLDLGQGVPFRIEGPADGRVERAVARFLDRVAWKTGVAPTAVDPAAPGLLVRYASPCRSLPELGEDESYQIVVDDGRMLLEASTGLGVIRGLETLYQLVRLDEEGWYLPGVRIADEPRFPWRGILVDVCRHWIPPEVLKRNIDGMAAARLNVLHWHLTEDQGFRIESLRHPALQEQGSDGHYYTQEQAREIVAYAADRGIRVVPEFDIPGHVSSWLVGHPELGSAPGPYEIGRRWGVYDAALNPTDETVYRFLDSFLGEMADIFGDRYMHIGGDEVSGRHWDRNPEIQAFMAERGLEDNHALQLYFNQRISSILERHGKRMVGWDEILHPDLPAGTVVQSWRGPASLAGAVRQGNAGILSSGWYLDHMLPAGEHYRVDPIPADSDLTPTERERVLGGEACMWAEYVTWETVDGRIWPRTAAIAERLWSPSDVQDVDAMYERLEGFSADLDYFGLTHRSSFDRMLARLAAGGDASALRTLAEVLEPLKYYGRSGARSYTSLDPLNRLVDAVRPESDAARRFSSVVDAFLADSLAYRQGREELFSDLYRWEKNHARLLPTLEGSALLAEVVPVSRLTSEIARTGRQAVTFLAEARPAPVAWVDAARALFAEPPRAEVLIMIAPAVERLVAAVEVDETELDEGWTFRQVGAEEWLPASVPGTVHTDLMAAGRIGDVFWRQNEAEVQWIGYEDWEYRLPFTVPAPLRGSDGLTLRFDGLDTYAEVYLDGERILDADNMFRPWEVGFGARPEEGEHELRIRFRSPIEEVLPRMEVMSYRLPASNDVGEKTSPFTRKAPYHFGWDWGPRLVTSGIWRPVRLQARSQARIANLWLRTASVEDGNAQVTVTVEVASEQGIEGTLRISSPSGAFEAWEGDLSLSQGTQTVSRTIRIPDVQLWWPNGLGDQPLYDVRVDLEDAEGDLVNTALDRIGVRTLELRREPDRWGESFDFVVNGVPVFARGGNWIPADSFPHRVDPQRYEHLLGLCRDANMNMLRVWGGGIYEADDFYELCDEYGLLVWQDFMFACSMYPGDEAFLQNVRAEATWQVRRLRNRPSLALWCGNNECETAWFDWGWRRQLPGSVWDDYLALFHGVLPEVVAASDPDRSYWPSSPSSNLEAPAQDQSMGDVHYWDVWHGEQPFSAFTEQYPRFMSEYGFQSFPLMPSVERFTEPADRALETPVMLAHQKNPRGNQLIRTYMQREYPNPLDFTSFLYVSQVQQAEGMRIAAEHLRRNMPRSMGSLYWQIDDCWPVASWSGIDYYGTPKALQRYARRFYAPILVSPVIAEDTVSVWVVSDRREEPPATLTVRLLGLDGSERWTLSREVTVAPVSSERVVEVTRSEMLSNSDPAGVYLDVVLRDDAGRTLSENRAWFVPVKELDLPDPQLDVQVDRTRGGYRIRLSAGAIARDVHLEAPGHEGSFSDDFFDVVPGRPVTVRFVTSERPDPATFSRDLSVRSLRDAFVARER